MSGWPDKPGVPLNPERDGWHWINGTPREWVVFDDGPSWRLAGSDYRPADWAHRTYQGPCLLPAEVAAREAAAFQRGEAAALADWQEEPTGGLIKGGVLYLSPDRVAIEKAAAFQRGAEAAVAYLSDRQAAYEKRAMNKIDGPPNLLTPSDAAAMIAGVFESAAAAIRALPVPEDKA